jgi:hypothetical protein
VNVTIKLNDDLCREARHRAVDANLSLSGWISDLIRKHLYHSPELAGPRRTLIDLLGDERTAELQLEIPPFAEKPRSAHLEY